jgi:hypothetical protein
LLLGPESLHCFNGGPDEGRVTLTDEKRKGTRKRVQFPPDFVKEVDKLPADERRWRMIQYLEEHGEEVGPGEGYGPKVPRQPEGPGPQK